MNHAKIPTPISDLYLNLQTNILSFNTNSVYANIDSLFFNMDKDYLGMVLRLRNLNHPKLQTDMDLEKWDAATDYKGIHLRKVAGAIQCGR
ncbi:MULTISPECIES: hypothetical protein [Chitinophagaceae]